jgi:hypothetical protein
MIQRKQEQRFALLRNVYDATGGRTSVSIDNEELTECGRRAGLDDSQTQAAEEWLTNEGLLEGVTLQSVSLTHQGVVEIEASMTDPEEPTDHFPASVIQHVTNNYQINAPVGSIQTGSQNTANVTQSVAVGDEVMKHIVTLRQAANKLDADRREEALELVETIESEAQSSKPKKSVIRQCGEGLKTLLAPIDVVQIVAMIMSVLKN